MVLPVHLLICTLTSFIDSGSIWMKGRLSVTPKRKSTPQCYQKYCILTNFWQQIKLNIHGLKWQFCVNIHRSAFGLSAFELVLQPSGCQFSSWFFSLRAVSIRAGPSAFGLAFPSIPILQPSGWSSFPYPSFGYDISGRRLSSLLIRLLVDVCPDFLLDAWENSARRGGLMFRRKSDVW